MNEPMVSYDNIGFYLLSKFSSKHVKVVQSGQGADEVFAGYHWYPKLVDSQRPAEDYCQLFFDRDHPTLSEELQDSWISDDYTRMQVREYFSEMESGLDPVGKALKIDTHRMLVEDPVKRVDSNTMRWGLEARVPFLDHELIELAAKTPSHLKLKGNESKYILKKIAAKYIPEEVLYRPKGYFPVPELKHIQGPFKDYVLNFVDSKRFRDRNIFQAKFIEKLLAQPDHYITNLQGNMLWQVASLEIWLQEMGL